MSAPAVAPAATLELLAWLANGPRTYRETIEAWRSSCPRLSVWEDAIADGFVEVRRDGAGDALIALTPSGMAALEGAAGAVQAR